MTESILADLHWPHITRTVWSRIVLGVAVVVTVLGIVLLIAAWRTDRAIESHMGTASAEVLSAGVIRSSISFVTPDGTTYNPPNGVLYPTGLTAGQFIEVEYDERDPDTVRVAGRDATVALVPVGSVVLGTWTVAIVAVLILRRRGRDRPAVGMDRSAGG